MKIFNTYFIHEIFVVRNHNYRACIIFDCRRDDFDALNIQIIRRLIQNEHVLIIRQQKASLIFSPPLNFRQDLSHTVAGNR